MRILMIDNDHTWHDEFKSLVREEFGETAPVHSLYSVDECRSEWGKPGCLDDCEVAFIDLELGPGKQSMIADYDGRDVVLPLLRKVAPWIPAVLVTRHLKGREEVYREVSGVGFDSVLPKSALYRRMNGRVWKDLKTRAKVHRIAGLSGREPCDVQGDIATEMFIEDPLRVLENYSAGLGEATLWKAAGLGARRCLVEEQIQGFSGILAVKLHCQESGDGKPMSRRWLVKVGRSLEKLFREASGHRRAFVDGVSRNLSVPTLWPRPVVWEGTGLVAYEFADGMSTLLKALETEDLGNMVDQCAGQIAAFYDMGEPGTVALRGYLDELLGDRVGEFEANSGDESLGRRILSQPWQVWLGRCYGDFHGRNILVKPGQVSLIDFARYKDVDSRGLPLEDAAKLLVDLWAFNRASWICEDLASGSAWKAGAGRRIVEMVHGGSAGRHGSDTDSVLKILVAGQLFLYSGYADVGAVKRSEAREAVMGWAKGIQ